MINKPVQPFKLSSYFQSGSAVLYLTSIQSFAPCFELTPWMAIWYCWCLPSDSMCNPLRWKDRAFANSATLAPLSKLTFFTAHSQGQFNIFSGYLSLSSSLFTSQSSLLTKLQVNKIVEIDQFQALHLKVRIDLLKSNEKVAKFF